MSSNPSPLEKKQNTAPKKGANTKSKPEQILGNFAQSISEIVVDLTALEINTMVVDRITGDKFIPWQTYCSLYEINRQNAQRWGIDEETQKRYLSLRNQLALEYVLVTTDQESGLYEERMKQYLNAPPAQIPLPNPKTNNPGELEKLRSLLKNNHFVRSLRKMSELKACLDNHQRSIDEKVSDSQTPNKSRQVIGQEIKTDIIYAQTVIQLDGDMITRYSKEILDHPHKDLILKLHQESVAAGEKQWRGLFEFIVDLMQQAVEKGWNLLTKS
ncbi:hypothetical protein PN462_11065 [Spirulina sp. CS-785/01]|uniref:hypothetical protein n=1 Tax=Spirulina sp. CS-785/01 TaxID=3021716 RepID=UPI002330A53C|nr:hypothetical protein [Spirulina sp. CS-785/01]MDB9313640.1 hypothetical protein [Spirulina sp. CS-785/01]